MNNKLNKIINQNLTNNKNITAIVKKRKFLINLSDNSNEPNKSNEPDKSNEPNKSNEQDK